MEPLARRDLRNKLARKWKTIHLSTLIGTVGVSIIMRQVIRNGRKVIYGDETRYNRN